MSKRETISEIEPDALLLPEEFDEALMGYAQIASSKTIALYDRAKCIQLLMKDMSEEEAEEYFEFNIACAYVGEHTPAFAVLPQESDS